MIKFVRMIKINVDSLDFLEWAPDGEPRFNYLGLPFNGIAIDFYKNGNLSYEREYINGYREGQQKGFHSDGSVETIYTRKWSRYHGAKTDWYPNGKIKSETLWELGHKISEKEWDENGNVISEYSITNHPEKLGALEKDRQVFSDL